MRMKTYGWDAVKLSNAYTMEEIAKLRQQVIDDPDNENPEYAKGRCIYLYTKSARKKLDAIAYAVYYKQKDASKCA